MIHLPMTPVGIKNALFIAVLGALVLALCLAIAFGQKPPKFRPGEDVSGYGELVEAVMLKKMNLLELDIEALEERVTKLEEGK